MKVQELLSPAPSDKGAKELSLIPDVYKNKGIGGKRKFVKKK